MDSERQRKVLFFGSSVLFLAVIWVLVAYINASFAIFFVGGFASLVHLVFFSGTFGHFTKERKSLLIGGVGLSIALSYLLSWLLLLVSCSHPVLQNSDICLSETIINTSIILGALWSFFVACIFVFVSTFSRYTS